MHIHTFTLSNINADGLEMAMARSRRKEMSSHGTKAKILVRFKKKQKKEVLPEELSSSWTDLNQAAGQAFSFHHRRRRRQFVSLHQSTGDSGRRRALPGRDDDAHAVVTTSSHGAAPCVHHEADQEPDGEPNKGGKRRRQRVMGGRETVKKRGDIEREWNKK